MRFFLLSCCFWYSTADLRAQEVVRLGRTYRVKDVQRLDSSSSNRSRDCFFRDEETFVSVRRLKRGGEIQFCSIRKNEVARTPIPLPASFKPTFAWLDDSYFHSPQMWANAGGDLFFLWTMRGNGDHGLALYSKKSKKIASGSSVKALEAFSQAVCDADGSWYLVRWNGDLSVYRIDPEKKFGMEHLGSHEGLGFHRYGAVDACFRAKEVLHCVYVQVELGLDYKRVRFHAVDFDIAKKRWSERRTLADLKKGVSSAHPRVVLCDGKPHYFWTIDEWDRDTPDAGLHYLADGKKKSIRLAKSVQFQVLSLGKKLVVCYSREGRKDKLFFRVIEAGKVGPESGVKISNHLENSLWGEDIVLGVAGKDRLWLVNTTEINTFYELKIGPP